jgi:hypothetical protein
MAGEIDALITVDRSLPFQQRLHSRPFAVIVLCAPSNRLDDLLPLAPALLQVLTQVKPGEIRKIIEYPWLHWGLDTVVDESKIPP